ncbi:hypothetical protein [Hymenobacter sp. DG01]|uniref:hypothetical protein n=1 Tax=Hymenobacter sp. DG01 TaxID=2584940 RepID=UPI00111F138B|nr:hypothetical protein [Hymenobacter sp. DG01]
MNSALASSCADFLDLGYRADIKVLTVRWLRSVSREELQAGFEQARQLSLEQEATRWLVDVRRRSSLDAVSSAWVAQDFLPMVARGLGSRLMIAYLLSPAREVVLRIDPGMRAATEAALNSAQPYSLQTFIDEGPATQWLLA